MRSFLIALLAIFYATLALAKPKVVTLTESELVTLRGEIDEELVSKVSLKLLSKQGKKIYLYIDSPGGSIVDGMRLINVIKALSSSGTQVVCIAEFAASMAFSIFQSCPVRYALQNSIIMQHQASYGVSGTVTENRSKIKLIEALAHKLNIIDSERLGLPMEEFVNKIYKTWWLFDDDIVQNKAADELILVKCDENLIKHRVTETVRSRVGVASLTWSGCPTVSLPLSADVRQNQGAKLEEFEEWFNTLPISESWRDRQEVYY